LEPLKILTKMKSIIETIGTFTVRDNTGRIRNVIISQELVMSNNGVVESAKKQHNIDKQGGGRVLATTDPAKFVLEDGTEFRKVGNTNI